MAAKSTPVQKDAAGPSDASEPLGFWISLRMPHGTSHRSETQLQRGIEDHVHELGMRIAGGTQRHLYITADDRDLALADQIDLVDWCLTHTQATQVAVTSLTWVSTMRPVTVKVLSVERFDLATFAVSWLYRMGRICAEQYAEILGGFLPDPNGELFA